MDYTEDRDTQKSLETHLSRFTTWDAMGFLTHWPGTTLLHALGISG